MARTPRWESACCEFCQARQRSFMPSAYAVLGSWAAAEAYARRVLVNTCIATYPQRRCEVLRGELPEGSCGRTTTSGWRC